MSSGKTIGIKCDETQEATSKLDEVEKIFNPAKYDTPRTPWKSVERKKRTIEENNIGTEIVIEMSLRLMGGTDKSESWGSLGSEVRDKKRWLKKKKRKQSDETKSRRVVLKNNRCIEKIRRKTTKRWNSFYNKSRIQ